MSAADVVVVGSVNNDEYFHVAHVVRLGETIGSHSYARRAGGKGANQAVAAAAAGVRVLHTGKVGADGEWLPGKLASHGVDTTMMQRVADAHVPTGRALIQVDASGDNAIVLMGGANHSFDAADLARIFGDARVVPGSVLLLQNEINNLDAIIRAGKQRGMRIAFNIAPMSPEALALPLDLVDTLILNEIEARELAQVGETVPMHEMLQTLGSRFPQAELVVTLGAKGVWGAEPATPREFVFVPAFPVAKVIDTTGAGDTFTGFFVAARLVRALALRAALSIAAEAAALCVQRHGTLDSVPSLDMLTQKALLQP